MNTIFMGTPAFADTVLRALLTHGYRPDAVMTQPPRPSGRGLKLVPAPVAVTAVEAGIPVYTPQSLKNDDTIERLRPNLLLTVAYGLILPQRLLDVPRYALNLHASLLPRWRGAAPIQRCIEAGDTQTGITLMHMSRGADEGDVVSMHPLPIAPDDTAPMVHDALAALAAQVAVDVVAHLSAPEAAPLPRTPQPTDGACYAEKMTSDAGRITPDLPLHVAYNRFRAFTPRAFFEHEGERVKIVACTPTPSADAFPFACRDGTLYLIRVQRPGGKPILGRELKF